ncbi:MAG: hypothetical protein INR68_03415 [Methylobacterium mesophilicum]|nr:hypothetical protein [Methylobacterium mesophilicum]
MSRKAGRPPAATSGGTSLWAAVINQALLDATAALPPSAFKDGQVRGAAAAERARAREWFSRGSADFIEVCNLAGFDPEAVREGANFAIARADRAERQDRGRAFNLSAFKGTGAGSDEQNTPELEIFQ